MLFVCLLGIVLGVFNVVSGLILLQARIHVFIHTYSEERNDIFDLSEALTEYYSNYALYRKVEALFIFSVAFWSKKTYLVNFIYYYSLLDVCCTGL